MPNKPVKIETCHNLYIELTNFELRKIRPSDVYLTPRVVQVEPGSKREKCPQLLFWAKNGRFYGYFLRLHGAT